MRDQSKAVLNTKLQVEKSSRIQGVPDAIIIDGYVMLWTVHWPTSDTVEDNIINCMGEHELSPGTQCRIPDILLVHRKQHKADDEIESIRQ